MSEELNLENITIHQPENQFIEPPDLLALVIQMKDLEHAKTHLKLLETQLNALRNTLCFKYCLNPNDNIDITSGKIIRK